MKLNSIKLTNFRCFKDLEVDLHPEVTVLVADNGEGKSTLLDAIRIAVWPFIKGFDLARTSFNDSGNSITISDAHITPTENGDMFRHLPCEIVTSGDYGDGQKSWSRYRESEAVRSNTKDDKGSKSLEGFARKAQKSLHQGKGTQITLPVFGYYGTGRLWAQQSLVKAGKGEKDDTLEDDFYIRTFGYRNCTNPSSSYKHFKEWFIWASESLSELRSKPATDPKTLEIAESRVTAVQHAINSFLQDTTGWHQLEYSIADQKSLILHHNKQGKMKIDQMSDGIRSMLSMVGDIAYRCIKLNPHLKVQALTQTSGVILIDEVDMHLHPSWQQLVIRQLRKTFPQIQFIVTTHSPQVLSTVPAECIRLLYNRRNGATNQTSSVAEQPSEQSKGVASANLMATLMGVDPVPKVEEAQDLSQYKTLIQQGLHSTQESKNLRQKLEKHFGAKHPEILDCDRLIRFQSLKEKMPKKSAN